MKAQPKQFYDMSGMSSKERLHERIDDLIEIMENMEDRLETIERALIMLCAKEVIIQ